MSMLVGRALKTFLISLPPNTPIFQAPTFAQKMFLSLIKFAPCALNFKVLAEALHLFNCINEMALFECTELIKISLPVYTDIQLYVQSMHLLFQVCVGLNALMGYHSAVTIFCYITG